MGNGAWPFTESRQLEHKSTTLTEFRQNVSFYVFLCLCCVIIASCISVLI